MKRVLLAFGLLCTFHVLAETTVVYSDDFNRTELSDATHTYTSNGQVSLADQTLKLACPQDDSNGRNYVVGNFGMRANLTNVDADSVVWLVSVRQNYSKDTTILSGFDEGERGVAAILLMDGTNPLSANGYALTYGGTGKQQFCLTRFAGGLSAQSNMTPIISGPASTNANKKYWSFRVVYKKANQEWALYQSVDDAFPAAPVTSWTLCGQAMDTTYVKTPVKQFGFLQNYTGTITFNMWVDNLSLSLVKGDQPIPTWPSQIQARGTGSSDSWKTYNVTTTHNLKDFSAREHPRDAWNRYGSYRYLRTDSTGFYYVKKIDGRWWMIDPDGYAGIHHAITSLSNEQVQYDYDICDRTGFIGIGNFVASESQTKNAYNDYNYRKMGYTRRLPFYSQYKQVRHKYYPDTPEKMRSNDEYIFTLDPCFARACDSLARNGVKQYANERDMVGWFTDNEIPFDDCQLHLLVKNLPATDSCRILALQWAADHGLTEADCVNKTAALTSTLSNQFNGYLAECYFKAVYNAIRKYDSNHLILGSRLHGASRHNTYIVAASHKYMDVTSANWYGVFHPKESIAQTSWTQDKPCMVGEYYTKDADLAVGLNQSGAGWFVHGQAARGYWFHNATVGFVENKCFVGLHYFRYMDDEDGTNKGIMSLSRQEYKECTEIMREVNEQIYALCDYYDGVARDTTLGKETNLLTLTAINDNATGTTIPVCYAKKSSDRKYGYIQFELPKVTNPIVHAELVLNVAQSDAKVHHLLVSAVGSLTDSSLKNRIGADLDSMKVGQHIIDVTTYMHDVHPSELFVKLSGNITTGGQMEISSSKAADATLRPQLRITYLGNVLTDVDVVQESTRHTVSKIIENGQLVIIKNNKKYNTLGMPQ